MQDPANAGKEEAQDGKRNAPQIWNVGELAKQMKAYETEFETQLRPWQPFLVRLDGHQFSKFTGGGTFVKPFDERLWKAMLHTAADVLFKFNASTAYTQSDEITLIFAPARAAPEEKSKDLLYEGRVLKLASVMAGYCTVRFVHHMSRYAADGQGRVSPRLAAKIHTACFDGRAFNLPTNADVLNNICWRIADVKRNSKHNLGRAHFAHKQLAGLSPKAIAEKLEKEKGVSWWDQPAPFRVGCFVKRAVVEETFGVNDEAEEPQAEDEAVAHPRCVEAEDEEGEAAQGRGGRRRRDNKRKEEQARKRKITKLLWASVDLHPRCADYNAATARMLVAKKLTAEFPRWLESFDSVLPE